MVCLTLFRVYRVIKLEIKRNRIKYGDEPQYMNIEFKDEIIISAKENTMSIPYDKVLKYNQTYEFIIVRIKAKMVVILKKDSFVEGTCDECFTFLNSICK